MPSKMKSVILATIFAVIAEAIFYWWLDATPNDDGPAILWLYFHSFGLFLSHLLGVTGKPIGDDLMFVMGGVQFFLLALFAIVLWKRSRRKHAA